MTDPPRHVDCRAVIHELYTFLDGELTEHKRMQVTQHLIACIDCHEVVDFYAELKMTISGRCREQVPPHLRQRIIDSLGTGGGWGPGAGIPRI
ncbi:MAG: mycothiol system anti-sigma-R factor [Anaerolineales bacterium]